MLKNYHRDKFYMLIKGGTMKNEVGNTKNKINSYIVQRWEDLLRRKEEELGYDEIISKIIKYETLDDGWDEIDD